MSVEVITINSAGVGLLGFPLGFTPKCTDLESVLGESKIRTCPPLDHPRQLRICDTKGLSWLVETNRETVLWLHIRLATFRYRPQDDHDPTDVFKGKVRIGQYTVQGPFSFETGEIVRTVVVPGLSIGFLPDDKLIRSISVSFTENEMQSDACSNRS